MGKSANRKSQSGQIASCGTLCVLVAVLCACVVPAGKPRQLASNHLFRPTRDAVISSPVAYDWDGDGVLEMAVGSWDGYFYLLDAQLNDLPGWPRYSRKGYFSSPALADLDGDGQPEVVVGSEAGKLFAWRVDRPRGRGLEQEGGRGLEQEGGRELEQEGGRGPEQEGGRGLEQDSGREKERGRARAEVGNIAGYPVELGYKMWASPTVLDGNRLAVGGKGQMFVLDEEGNVADGWPQPFNGWPDATAAYAAGLLALTTLTPGDPSHGWIYAWRENGELLPGFPLELAMDSDSSPAWADLDGDGRWWIVFGDDAGWLHVVDTEGEERPGFPVRTLGPQPGPTPTPHPPGGNVHSIEASPAIADLDNDGRLEIAVGSWDGRMYVWDDAGRSLPGWPVEVGDQIISSAALVDLDGDDRLDIVVGCKDRYLYGWTARGRLLPGFPYDLGHHVFSSPWVGDLEGDGRADIAVGANNGIHLIRDVGPLGRAGWPMFHHDEGNTGRSDG